MVFSRFLLLLTQNTEKNCNVRFYRVNSFWSSVLVRMNGRMKKIKIITTCVCHFICVCMFAIYFNVQDIRCRFLCWSSQMKNDYRYQGVPIIIITIMTKWELLAIFLVVKKSFCLIDDDDDDNLAFIVYLFCVKCVYESS